MRNVDHNKVYSDRLGISFGTAANRLRKMIMFDLVKRLGLNVCFCCNLKIKSCRELSIEHKKNWRNSKNASKLFFDLKNISFSHLSCNSSRSSGQKNKVVCGKVSKYRHGCRCDKCRKANADKVRNGRLAQKRRALVLHTKG